MSDLIKIQSIDDVLVVDSRLIAQRLNVDHSNLLETLTKYQSRIESRFGQFPFKTEGVRNSVGALNQVKYALLTEPQATALLTFTRNTDEVIEAKLDLVESFEKAKAALRDHPQPPTRTFWREREIEYHAQCKVPQGYWTVFEQTIHIVARLEAFGYILPDDHYPDISVGICWANYLRKIGTDIDAIARYYQHVYPDYRGAQPARCYSMSVIGDFHYWLEDEYKASKMLAYFAKKSNDPRAIGLLQRFIALPPAIE